MHSSLGFMQERLDAALSESAHGGDDDCEFLFSFARRENINYRHGIRDVDGYRNGWSSRFRRFNFRRVGNLGKIICILLIVAGIVGLN